MNMERRKVAALVIAPDFRRPLRQWEVRMSEEGLQLLITLDDPWNAKECDTFNSRLAEHAVSGQPDQTRGRHDRRAEEIPCDGEGIVIRPDQSGVRCKDYF